MLKAGSRTSPGWKDEKWIPVRIRGTELEHTSVRVVALVESRPIILLRLVHFFHHCYLV
jgi:hypothetical protein